MFLVNTNKSRTLTPETALSKSAKTKKKNNWSCPWLGKAKATRDENLCLQFHFILNLNGTPMNSPGGCVIPQKPNFLSHFRFFTAQIRHQSIQILADALRRLGKIPFLRLIFWNVSPDKRRLVFWPQKLTPNSTKCVGKKTPQKTPLIQKKNKPWKQITLLTAYLQHRRPLLSLKHSPCSINRPSL